MSTTASALSTRAAVSSRSVPPPSPAQPPRRAASAGAATPCVAWPPSSPPCSPTASSTTWVAPWSAYDPEFIVLANVSGAAIFTVVPAIVAVLLYAGLLRFTRHAAVHLHGHLGHRLRRHPDP